MSLTNAPQIILSKFNRIKKIMTSSGNTERIFAPDSLPFSFFFLVAKTFDSIKVSINSYSDLSGRVLSNEKFPQTWIVSGMKEEEEELYRLLYTKLEHKKYDIHSAKYNILSETLRMCRRKIDE